MTHVDAWYSQEMFKQASEYRREIEDLKRIIAALILASPNQTIAVSDKTMLDIRRDYAINVTEDKDNRRTVYSVLK